MVNKQGEGKIAWTDFTANPIDGLCKYKCFYCYEARRRERFKLKEDITYRSDWFDKKQANKLGSAKIFVGSTHDLFGDWISSAHIKEIISVAWQNPQHIFQFLTKNPKRYLGFNFPKNCWLGTTLTGIDVQQLPILDNMFISYEPLMGQIGVCRWVKWVIIGAMSGAGSKEHQPKLKWINDIVERSQDLNIPIFMKDSLKDIYPVEIKEFPKEAMSYK